MGQMTYDDELLLEQLWEDGESVIAIAATLGLCRGTIYQELKLGFTEGLTLHGRPKYSALKALRQRELKKKKLGKNREIVNIDYQTITEEINPEYAIDEKIMYGGSEDKK